MPRYKSWDPKRDPHRGDEEEWTWSPSSRHEGAKDSEKKHSNADAGGGLPGVKGVSDGRGNGGDVAVCLSGLHVRRGADFRNDGLDVSIVSSLASLQATNITVREFALCVTVPACTWVCGGRG